MYLCVTHTKRVTVLKHGVFHSESGHLCDSSHVVTPSGPRPAEQLRAQAHLVEAAAT